MLQEKLDQALRRAEEMEELLVEKKGLEGQEELIRKLNLLEETVASLEEENRQLRNGGAEDGGMSTSSNVRFPWKNQR